MSNFEMFTACLLIPVTYVLVYIAGKYDILNLVCKMLEEECAKYKVTVALNPCPFCGGEAILTQCGDQKEYLVYRCSKCHRTPVKYCEARITERGARKIWNRRCKQWLTN